MAPTKTKAAIGPGTDENLVNLDFRGLRPRSGGKAAHVPEGDYLLQVVEMKNVEIKNGVNKGNRQIACQFRIVGTPNTDEARAGLGDSVYQNAQLGEKSLWWLRNLIEDLMGAEVTGKAFAFKLDDKAGRLVGALLIDGAGYTNASGDTVVRSEIKMTFPADRFVGYSGVSQAADDAPAAKVATNGVASAEAAAQAVASSDDDEELAIEDLENI